MVSFLPLDVTVCTPTTASEHIRILNSSNCREWCAFAALQSEDSIDLVLSTIDHAIQFGEDEEPKEPKDDAPEGDGDGDDGGADPDNASFAQYMAALGEAGSRAGDMKDEKG
jgi:hypothetical protein